MNRPSLHSSRPSAEAFSPLANEHVVFVLASVLVGASLFLPHPMNFAPIGAFGLFAGTYASTRRVWLYPLGALAVYVTAIGGYAWLVLASVFLGFAGPAVIGSRWLKGRVGVLRVVGSAMASSVWFFLVSNLGSWLVFGAPGGETLLHHYARGIPYFGNTLSGDLFFSTVLFGGYALARGTARRPAPSADAAVRP